MTASPRGLRRMPAQRGISLIEALVAMGVMAFGMLGVVGMQATLRTNADVAKQRAEAVRIAQAAVEDWRAFETLAPSAACGATPPPPAFDCIANVGATAVTGYTTNTSYTYTATVQPAVLAADAPRLKTFAVNVTWTDRNGLTPSVGLISSVAGIAPEISGSLGLPKNDSPMQRPGGMHPGIPRAAVYNTAINRYTLTPVPAGTTYVFDSLTGVITQECTVEPATPSNPPAGCTAVTGLPLSGFIRFATGTVQPTDADAENPIGAPVAGIGVAISPLTLPVSPAFPPVCYTPAAWSGPTHVGYFCVVPTTPAAPFRWTGKSMLTLPAPVAPATTPVISALLADADPANYKVCRYTPVTNDVVPNADHPLVYTNATTPLWNQNFFVIRAGNGTTPYTCPVDSVPTPINATTYRHQPLT